MNQEIEFRGKDKKTGNWVYGYSYQHAAPLQCIASNSTEDEKPKTYICKAGFADWNMPRPVDFFEVDPDTVGQFIGRFDAKNKRKIYDGDLLKIKISEGMKEDMATVYETGVIKWDQKTSGFRWYDKDGISWVFTENEDEVVGNIYDNSGLLNEPREAPTP